MNVYRYAIETLAGSYVSNSCQFDRLTGKIRAPVYTLSTTQAKLFKRERDAKGFITKGKSFGILEGAEIVPLYLFTRVPIA